jgi:FkbM family methyltransferase
MINWPEGRNSKKNAFVLASTDHGTMLVNRFDFNVSPDGVPYGVGYNLLETSSFDPPELNLIMQLLTILRHLRGDGVVMVDGGANVGVHALTAGRLMQGWGSVISIEAQERVFYALAGNVALNNLFNVKVKWNALAQTPGIINIPVPDYLRPSSFGSLELQYHANSENIGQPIDMQNCQPVQAISIDSLELSRLDFMKLDVEGMEEQVLLGASATLARCKPVLHIEQLKSDYTLLHNLIRSFGYVMHDIGPNTLCVPENDEVLNHIVIR